MTIHEAIVYFERRQDMPMLDDETRDAERTAIAALTAISEIKNIHSYGFSNVMTRVQSDAALERLEKALSGKGR